MVFLFIIQYQIIINLVRMIDEADTNCIVDRYFYECYKKMSGQITKHIWYYSVRSIILALSLPVNHFIFEEGRTEKMSLFSIFLIVTLAISVLQIILFSYLYFTRIKNKNKIVKLAAELHHTKQIDSLKSVEREEYDELGDLYQVEDTITIKVSNTYYDFENMEKINDVSTQFKLMREKVGENLIRVSLQSDMKLFKGLERILQLGSAAIFICGFLVGSISPLNEIQHSLLEAVLISEVIIKPKIFTLLIIICLVPVIILGMCFYLCCCKKQQRNINLPKKIPVTTQTLAKCSECSICFQDFVKEEEIIVLPCADCHIFHSTCIQGWTKIKPNCPICRAQL